MSHAKIAIIGGGPGGASTALYALERGIDPEDITLFDAAHFPRKKLCGGGLTFRGSESLQELLGERPFGRAVPNLIFRASLGDIEVREPGPQYLYDRGILDHALIDRCRARGIRVVEGARLKSIEPGASAHRLVFADGTRAKAVLVVGADGARSVVRREAGLRGGPLGRLVEAVYGPGDSARFEAFDKEGALIFDFEPVLMGIPGYRWAFPYPLPDGERRFKVGIMDGRGIHSGERLREETSAYAESLGLIPLEPKIAGWPEHYFHRKSKAHTEGIFLTGEAWGIDPLLGEGIAPAYQMGAYAASRLKEALDRGVRKLPDYERRFLRSEEGKNLVFQGFLADRLYGQNGAHWLSVLFANPRLRELAARETEVYGRLRRRAPELILSYIALWWREHFGRRPRLTLPRAR
ncbi:MAG: NAD(P)/FAD-dependent oxidoreductase [Sandaracinaceae bacterium]|nr:NAD(P)/FAD-dependent oxidoreductase [Sandaracinaceae bacterium]